MVTPRATLAHTLASLLQRRSVAPRRLGLPAPTRDELGLMLQAALRGPDHARLAPWRVVEFSTTERPALARRFEAEKLRRDPVATEHDRMVAREHALLPPLLLGFVFSPRARTQVPLREQWLAAGAALGNLLNAAHLLGYGASILSGERCFDAQLVRELGLVDPEELAGFISIGSVARTPPAAQEVAVEEVWSVWQPV